MDQSLTSSKRKPLRSQGCASCIQGTYDVTRDLERNCHIFLAVLANELSDRRFLTALASE